VGRQDARHAADVEAVGLPAFLDDVAGIVEDDAIGKRGGTFARILARDEAVSLKSTTCTPGCDEVRTTGKRANCQ